MVGWYHQFNGHEFEQAPRDGEGQGSLGCCSPWGCKESDTTEQLINKVSMNFIMEKKNQKELTVNEMENEMNASL